MDSTILEPFNSTYDDVDRQADAHVESLLNLIRTDLQDIKITLSGEDSPLENCWDEVCAHWQGEEFLIWEPYRMTIEGVIEGCFDDLPHKTQLYINFAALVASDYRTEEHDYEAIYEERILTFLYDKVMELALKDTNPRIEAYLDPYTPEEESQYNADEYLLLRIDPARRDDFLAALDLFGFVKNIAIDDEGIPYLFDLLDHVDIPEN
ncbi:hypothetical protein [Larkinella sp. C7]|uniref:hypothetical protein n=1 Tax=Larkinella sp. C7 TaxID=2576607 RepID=UPI0011113055|nr:hypothetical protein [Larkinella sp. C7]